MTTPLTFTRPVQLYIRGNPPADPKALQSYLMTELQKLEASIKSINGALQDIQKAI